LQHNQDKSKIKLTDKNKSKVGLTDNRRNNLKINDACGCSISDLIGENPENCVKEEATRITVENSDKLCNAHNNDVEMYVEPDAQKISHDFYLKKMTDGLPIIPPTREKVRKFLKFTDRHPDEVIAVLPPIQGKATMEKIAINSVMAGCIPAFIPVIQHAIQAVSNEKFNLPGVNATTHPVAICTILNGPISYEIDINNGVGCLGPGNIANATIGRALRLCMINIAGAIPGIGDHSTMGSPAKYSYCFGENENESPWEPLNVERGLKEDYSTVTVMAAEAPQNVNDHRSKNAEELLDTIIQTLSTAGCNNSHVPGELLVIMGPEHVQTVAKEGWGKTDVKNYIHENALVPVDLADRGGRKLDEKWIIDDQVKLTRSPDDVVMVVAGGPGRHTMIAHGFGTSSQSVTIPLALKNGEPAKSIRDFKQK